jgi:hypothetical protein
MRPTINNSKKKNGRTRTAAKGKSLMVRCIPQQAADFKAGVAIPNHIGDRDDNLRHPPSDGPHARERMRRG